MQHLNNNQHTALVGDGDDEKNRCDKENDTKSTGVENYGKTTGVQYDNKTTGVESDNESTGVNSESVSTGATDKADEMALIEEAISEAGRDIAEWTELLAGTETETEDTRDKKMIHPDLHVLPVEQTYNLRRRRNTRTDYTNRYGFQATITHCALTQLLMKCRLKKVKQKSEKAVTAELEQL